MLRARPGVSLVEVLVAVTLMTVVLTGLGGLAFTAARQTTNVSASSYRLGLLSQEVDRISALPFARLGTNAGCTTTSTGAFPHQRCITVTAMTTDRARVSIIVRPLQPGVSPDTVILERTRPPTGNPLSTN